MKANKLYNTTTLWVLFLLYSVWVIVSAVRHEANGDEYHVWRMVHDMNFSELWAAMSTEGHFLPWYIMQWPFVKWIGMDYHCIYIVSDLLMLVAAWLLLFRLDFNVIGKVFILFSAPFCYNFPTIARCYALIPPILVGIAILYQKKEKPFLYCLLLGLLANTHAYMEGLVAILWCLFVYNQVIVKWKSDTAEAKKNLIASLLTIVLVIIAFLQVVGGLIAVENGINPPGEGKNTLEKWFSMFNGGYRFKSFQTLHRYFRLIPKIDVLATIVLWILVVIGCYEYLKNTDIIKWQLVSIIFFGIAWQIFFACNIYGMNWQRIDLLYFIVVFAIWIAYKKKNTKWSNLALIAFWFLNTSSRYVVVKDVCTTSAGDETQAKKYEKLMTKDAPCYTACLVGPHDLMDRKFQFVHFDYGDTLATEDALLRFTNQTGDCYLMIPSSLNIHNETWVVDSLVTINDIELFCPLYYIKRNEKTIE